MRLYLFDDARARQWTPFSTTRPVGELLFGCMLLRERAERFWNNKCNGQLIDPDLKEFKEPGSPPIIYESIPGSDEPTIFFSSRAVPGIDSIPPTDVSARLVIDDQIVGWIIPPNGILPQEKDFLNPNSSTFEFPFLEINGQVLEEPWDMIACNSNQIKNDVPEIFSKSPFKLPEGVHHSGAEMISIAPGVKLEAGVYLDTSNGPIHLSEDSQVMAFTRIAGPAFVGPGSHLLGGHFQEVSIGPACKVRGEVVSSVLLGYSNKAHDGYLGHSYAGKWVNLGALTTNSDLKNNYSTVRVPTVRGKVDTGLIKMGCMIGDHVKTGIGTLLATGSVIGAGSNLFGGLLFPQYVPPFTWGSTNKLEEYHLDLFLKVVERSMGRRDIPLLDETRTLLENAWKKTKPDRS